MGKTVCSDPNEGCWKVKLQPLQTKRKLTWQVPRYFGILSFREDVYRDEVEAASAIGFDLWRVDGSAGVTDRDIDGWIPPVVCRDEIGEPGVRDDKLVRDRASAPDRGTASGTLPVDRHISMSLLQAPDSTPIDGGVSVAD